MEHRYWVAWNLIPGIGGLGLIRLWEYFGSVQQAWEADEGELTAALGGERNLAGRIAAARAGIEPDREWADLQARKIGVATLADTVYPDLLREIYNPPPLLYYLGDLSLLNTMPCIAMVGSRTPSHYGRGVAKTLAAGLAGKGFCIVSGAARGIDTRAHQGALQAGSPTAAVLGCGLDVAYPPENKELIRQIAATGVVLTELPLTSQPLRQNFPARNRIISGLSKAVIVVEAARKSGALITANFALEQNREVLAVPGPINSYLSEGTNSLIKDGAGLIAGPEDILAVLGVFHSDDKPSSRQLAMTLFSQQESAVMAAIGSEAVNLDSIIERTGIAYDQISLLLTELELKGAISRVPGFRYIKVDQDN